LEIFEGYSITSGAALASAAKVRFDFGIPALMPARLHALGERLMREQDGYVETEQIILVSETMPSAILAASMPGIDIIGVAITGHLREPVNTDAITIPIVAGLENSFLRQVEEYDLLIVDADNGLVYLSPDAMAVAHFQSPARRRRYFMEGVHLTATTTSDQRAVAVLAEVVTMADVETAMRYGADGVYLGPNNRLLIDDTGAQATAADHLATLDALIDVTGGKPIIIDMAARTVAVSAALQAAVAASVSLVVNDAAAADELAADFFTARTFAPPYVRFGDVHLMIAIDPTGDNVGMLENLDIFSSILLRRPVYEYPAEYLLAWLGLACRCGKPVYALLPADWQSEIEDVVQLGLNVIGTALSETADVKDTIREL
jgi:cellulose biosynthesis protein BcsQ